MTIIDTWAGLDHKSGMGETPGGLDVSPQYMSDADRRRINAYHRIRAYIETVARLHLAPNDDDPDKVDNHREYGDPAVLVERIAAAVLGKDPFVAIVDADVAIPEVPAIPPAPQEPDEGLADVERSIADEVYATSIEVWEANAREELERWQEQIAERPKLQGRQDWLQAWADDDQFIAKVTELETEFVVPMGSGVIRLGWDGPAGRVSAEIYEPDVYVPVLDDARPSEFPKRVHLVWQFVDPETEEDMVRRITYELVPVEGEDVEPGVQIGSQPRYLGNQEGGDGEGRTWTESCLYSNGVWALDAFESTDDITDNPSGGWEQVDIDGVLQDANRVPIGLDFIPLVHVPNTLSTTRHFGRSPIVRLAQLFDEIAATDTDEALASWWAARPPAVVSGLNPGTDSFDMTPGKAAAIPEGGSMDTIDMAMNLEKIGQRLADLLKRLSVNAQVPEGLLGRVDASDVPSGIAFTLSFTAFEQLIEKARMARDVKYALVLKFVQRIAIQNDDPGLAETTDPGLVFPAEMKFGAFMPQDLLSMAQIMKILTDSGLLATETGLLMGQEAGIPSEDLAAELASIRAMQAEIALGITDAVGPEYAAEFLGIRNYEASGVDPEASGGPPPPGAVAPPAGDPASNGVEVDA